MATSTRNAAHLNQLTKQPQRNIQRGQNMLALANYAVNDIVIATLNCIIYWYDAAFLLPKVLQDQDSDMILQSQLKYRNWNNPVCMWGTVLWNEQCLILLQSKYDWSNTLDPMLRNSCHPGYIHGHKCSHDLSFFYSVKHNIWVFRDTEPEYSSFIIKAAGKLAWKDVQSCTSCLQRGGIIYCFTVSTLSSR